MYKKVSYVVLLHVLEAVNLTGYKLIYALGTDYDYYCCRDLNKVSQLKTFGC